MNSGKIPDEVTDLQAVMVSDMISTAWNGLDNTHFRLGDNVAVFGIGPVGLCAIAGVRRKGAGRIFAIGTNPKGHRAGAGVRRHGHYQLQEGDVVAQIRKKNGGPWTCRSLRAETAPPCPRPTVSTRPGGQICSVNAFYDDVVISPGDWNSGMETKQMTGYQNTGGRWMFERYLNMLKYDKTFDPSKIITHINHGLEGLEETPLEQKKRGNASNPSPYWTETSQ